MEQLKIHEQFEMKVLDQMRSLKCLDKLIFGGGTMLRLCFRLPRYSVDLDFYVVKGKDYSREFKSLKSGFEDGGYELTDYHEKHFTYLLELRSPEYPRRLKIEIRKQKESELKFMTNIAFSPNVPTLQVRLKTCTLEQMWQNKVEALLSRAEIRDAFDLEFLLRRGAGKCSDIGNDRLSKMLEMLHGFKKQDFSNTLGNSLSPDDRKFYLENRFAFLKAELQSALSS